MKVGFIYSLTMKPFSYKKGKTDFKEALKLMENRWTETMLK
jgi:hypothetical protein